MQLSFRVGRGQTTHLTRFLLAGAILPLLTGPAEAQSAQATPQRGADNRILVDRINASALPSAGKTTLADAVARAVNDPRDNVIEFDPSVLGTEPAIIHLTGPINVDKPAGGHDRIDATGAGVPVTLDVSACPDAGIVVGGRGRLTLAGLTIQGGTQRAILVKDAGQLLSENLVIRGSAGPGIALFGQARLTLVRCQLVNNHTHGLELHGDGRAGLNQVEVLANGQSGLAAFDRSMFTATDCLLDANRDWNVVLTHHSQASLTRCQLRQSGFASADVNEFATLTCQDTGIEEGRRFGVFATGQARLELTRTTLRGHGGRGIELQDRAALIMQQSRSESNGDYGVILFGQSSIQATATTIAHNGAHGASLRNQACGQFRDCTFASNRYSGIGCLDAGQGGKVVVTGCVFQQNGMRPIYRGPLHLDPLAPTPLSVHGPAVDCLADPNATIELYLDRAGEAARYCRTVQADGSGRFRVDCRDVPEGWVMTATATANGSTSEFNVVAGTTAGPVLGALLGRTGPLSDHGGAADLSRRARRWKAGTHLILHVANPPSAAVERYARFLAQQIANWTAGTVTADVAIGRLDHRLPNTVIVPVRYLEPDVPQLMGRGGVTFMKWDADGYFLPPMNVVVAAGKQPEDTCPRVMAHEIGHVLGLCHARVGLLSRMQGSIGPSPAFVNDFSPILTYYDVLALHLLYDQRSTELATLEQLLASSPVPDTWGSQVVGVLEASAQPSFSPPAEQPADQPTVSNPHRP